jgi:C4-dicarboxylate transporter, DctM subunit
MISPDLIGLIGFMVLIIFIFLGFPIGFAMIVTGIAGLLWVSDLKATIWAVDSIMFHEAFHWTFIVLPMFFLLGFFAFHGGIGKDAYETFNKWLGKVRGGLIIATIGACTVVSFASGSSLATCATFTKLALPEMRKKGYDVALATGSIASAGTLDALIPPSGMMVIICVLTGMSLGKLMIAGIIPGIITAFAFILALKIQLIRKPELAPLSPLSVSLKEKIAALRWTGPLVAIIIFVFAGIYIGVFTPTEAGALGALTTFVFFVMKRGIWSPRKEIFNALMDTVKVCSMIFIIIIGAMIFTRFMVTSGLIDNATKFILRMNLAPVAILVCICLIWLCLGCIMEVVGILALTLPVFYPVLIKLGYDEIFIGILALMLMEIGVITPPVGTNCFVVKSVAGNDVSLDTIFRGIMPFFISYLFVVALLITFPSIVLYLPALTGFK